MVLQERNRLALARLAQLLARSPVRQTIVALLVAGRARKEIARDLGRSPHTIDAHLKAIYRHVGVGDRGRLMLLASQPPDLTPPPRKWGLSFLGVSPKNVSVQFAPQSNV